MATKLLIVDENKTDRKAVLKKLSHFECDCVELEEGSRLIPVAKAERPKLILLEPSSGQADGMELIQKLKAEEDLKNVPVLILSRHVTRENVIRAGKLGVRDFILKPVENAPLIERINRIVEIRRKPKTTKERVRVLIYDDKPLIFDQFKSIAVDTNWDIIGVREHEEAIATATDKEPDILIVSLSMPNDGGFQFISQVHANELFKGTPIFGLCVRTAVEEQTRAQHSGITGIITKPLDPNDVKHKIHRGLNMDTSQRYFAIKDNILYITFPAKIDATHTEFTASIKPQTAAMVDAGMSRILIDMSQVDGMDTEITKLLIQIVELCNELGVQYCVVGSSQTASKAKIFEETKNIQIFETIEDAIHTF